jgi:hypothetical protein
MLWIGLAIGVSGVVVALLSYAVIRVGTRQPIPPYEPPPTPYPPPEWRQGEPWDE